MGIKGGWRCSFQETETGKDERGGIWRYFDVVKEDMQEVGARED